MTRRRAWCCVVCNEPGIFLAKLDIKPHTLTQKLQLTLNPRFGLLNGAESKKVQSILFRTLNMNYNLVVYIVY